MNAVSLLKENLTGRECAGSATGKQMFLPQVGTIHCQSWTWNSVLVFQLWVLRSEPAQLLSGKARRRGTLVSQPHADAKQEGPPKHAGLERVGCGQEELPTAQ